jgi:chromosome segregation protein
LKFDRLRISGFKSFVEPTELIIEPGLTAIVGPNGCGKSNLFDALRWVMGESRPSSVRGTEMDDVIFAGSAARPARNVAEVILHVDNQDRTATGSHNEFDSIEISRRIEREAGSIYRINGRDVRQRDVQLFFADAASGATSTAFVRQGQIGLLVSQKPLARRAILEEAAGISGLHQRRHEAELRLRAAEANMARVDDVLAELESQLANLKRQARSAARYRNLSGLIRKAEALAALLRWNAAVAQSENAKQSLEAAARAVEMATITAAEASTAQASVAALLPPLRQTEAERGAALHRLVVERDTLDAEEARARDATQRLVQRIAQARHDREREATLDADAGAALERLSLESQTLEASVENGASRMAEAADRATELGDSLVTAERRFDSLTAELAEWNARKNSHNRARSIAAALVETSRDQLEAARRRLDDAMARSADEPDVRVADDAKAEAEAALASAQAAVAASRAARETARDEENAARGPLEDSERVVQRLEAEAKALADLLRPQGAELWPPLVDAITVEPGYEAALAAALGDDLEAPLDESAPHHWRELGALALPDLPRDADPLQRHVNAPAALGRRLAMTGVVAEEQGGVLQTQLVAGQRLVSQRGALWRWDGYTASAEAPSPAAVRLAQRNRLVALDTELTGAREKRGEFFARFAAAKVEVERTRDALRAAESDAARAQQALTAAHETAAKAARAAAERMSRLANLEAEIRRLTQTLDTAQEAVSQADLALGELGDGQALSEAAAEARTIAAEARSQSAEARSALETLRREIDAQRRRLAAIAEECKGWQSRRESAAHQIAELDRRLADMSSELAQLETVPAQIATKRSALLDAIAHAEEQRREAADARAAAENAQAEADREAKTANALLSRAREDCARAEAFAEAAASRLTELKERIRDELDAAPEELAERAELRENDTLPEQEQADRRVEKLKAEREQLGGVNLRAEDEAVEHQQRLDTLKSEREDLEGAIQRLRRGIQSLNREGRERLVESFEKVNANFEQLFTKLFGGGEARLQFTESEDPLEAGLEIFARPPGKKMQSLSLLSGGEQALTALSLIFAVFLVNPAPVCVLDEVDAPLDDANVERFCNLLDEMTRLTSTRFLVVTHHALTMSRMHRLIGVTMAERGVSQLVSVTLAEAERVVAAE